MMLTRCTGLDRHRFFSTKSGNALKALFVFRRAPQNSVARKRTLYSSGNSLRGEKYGKWSRFDKVPREYFLVYLNPVYKGLNWVQGVSAAFGIAIIPITMVAIFEGKIELEDAGKRVYRARNLLDILVMYVAAYMFIFTTFYIAAFLPQRVYRLKNEYIIVRNGFLGPFSTRKFHFNILECTPVTKIWNLVQLPEFLRDTVFKIRKNLFYLFAEGFNDTSELVKFLK